MLMNANSELLEVLPDPLSLIESMRSVGYSLEAAVADIVDNSLSAGAERISIQYDASSTPYVAILDDGSGMSGDELTEAMRHGRNPLDPRSANDLGRFGLGLKTASLSQGRRLTVVSRKAGETFVRCWDLDIVADKNRWVIEVPPLDKLKSLPLFDSLLAQECGTLVIWEKLDRLISGAKDPRAELTIKFRELEGHLALVFHRFVSGENGFFPVQIVLNGRDLPSCDPFLSQVNYTQSLEQQTIPHQLGRVVISPFVLPPREKLTSEQVTLAGGEGGLRSSQGFYIYRGRRLVIWGTWFRLTPKDEFYKLCRVRVDVPNAFDELWNLDIKKSAADPPSYIRERLRDLVPRFLGKSKTTVTYRGRVQRTASFCPLWEVIELPNGDVKYQINRNHPLVISVSAELSNYQNKNLDALLDLIGLSLPVDAIYATRCGDRAAQIEADFKEYSNMARQLMSTMGLSVEQVLTINPFDTVPEIHARLRRDLE